MININKETDNQLEKGPKFLDREKIERTLFEVAKSFPKIDHIDEITDKKLDQKGYEFSFNFVCRCMSLPDHWDPAGVVETPNFYFWAK